jgi:hypothetical protein
MLDDNLIPAANIPVAGAEPPRKKQKHAPEKDMTIPSSAANGTSTVAAPAPKKKVAEKPELPPEPPQMPKPKTLPCAVCDKIEPFKDQLLSCKECRMSVHRLCYGVVGEVPRQNKWTCDMCANDKTPQVSLVSSILILQTRFTSFFECTNVGRPVL